MKMTKRQRWLLAGVIAVGVLARVGWAVHVHEQEPALTRSPDTPSYTNPARSLVRDGAFDVGPGSDVAEFVRTPGYPAYVALVYAVTDESDLAVLIGQGLLGALTMLLVFALIRRFGASYALGLLGVLLVVFEPLQFAASGKLLTESVSALCLTLVAYCGVRMVQTSFRVTWAIALGLSLALATLVRPATYYFPILLAIVLVVYAIVRSPLRRAALTAAALVLVSSFVVLGAWQFRNHEEVGSWRLAGIEAVNMYWYRAAGAISEEDGQAIRDVRLRLTERLNEDLGLSRRRLQELALGTIPREKRNEQGQYLDEAYSDGLDLLRDHPRGFVVMEAKGLAREVGGVGDAYVLSYLRLDSNAPLRALGFFGLACFYVLVAAGVLSAAQRRWDARLAHLICLGLVTYVLVVSAGVESYARFRTPVMPVLAVYAALGGGSLWTWWRSRRRSAAESPETLTTG